MAGQFSAANLQGLARIITLCYFYFRSLRSVNKFLFWAVTYAGGVINPAIGSIPEVSDGVWQERSVDCSSGDGVRHFIVLCVLVVIGVQLVRAAEDGLIESTEAREDIRPSTDPFACSGLRHRRFLFSPSSKSLFVLDK